MTGQTKVNGVVSLLVSYVAILLVEKDSGPAQFLPTRYGIGD